MATQRSQSTVGSATIYGRLVHTRGYSVFLLLLVMAPVLAGLTVWAAVERGRRPDVGMTVNDQLEIEGVDARWTRARHGDRVLAVDDQPLGEPAQWVSSALARNPGDPIAMTFSRDGERWTEEATATEMRWLDRVAVGARIATAVALMAMGLIAFLMRPGIAATWLLLLVAWDLGLFLFLKVWLYGDPLRYKQASIYPFAVASSLGLHFCCIFPHRLRWFSDRPRRQVLLYLPILFAPIFHALTTRMAVTPLGTLWGAVAALALIPILVTQYRRVHSVDDAQGRSQYRAFMVGLAGGLVVPGVWNWLRTSYGVGASPWSAHYNALPLVGFVGLTTYAVVRHNALAIDRFTASVVGYAATMVILGGAFASALIGIPLLLGESGLGSSRVLLVTVTALTFAGFAPLYRRIKRWVDRRFFREQADSAQIADALRELVLEMQQCPREEAVNKVLEAASILRCDRIDLWILSDDRKALLRERSTEVDPVTGRPIRLDSALGQALRSGVTAGVEGLAPRVMDFAAQEELWARQLALAAPFVVHAMMSGFVGVGRKRSGLGYQMEELSFLSIVSAQLGSALERARSDKTTLDRYHLERRLGTGGMAEVFLAWQVGPGGFERKVAVKRPLPHVSDDPNAVAAFLDEARVAAQLRHANIAQVYDVGESDGSYFIVMEYVDGPSMRHVLRELTQRDERVPVAVAAAIVVAVLAALDYAHQHRDEHKREMHLVHRDITPRNVLVNRRGEVKLVDFGIARAQHQLHVTQTGTIKGTLPYMSPEQATGRTLDHRSDLYSAGALFYELVTGRIAFSDGPSRKAPPAATRLCRDLPDKVEAVLARAMAYDAAKRFASAGEQSQALLRALRPMKPASSEEVADWLASACADLLLAEGEPLIVSQISEETTLAGPSDPAEAADTIVQPKARG